jgi:membrane-associated protease RseP (regulator of RpoE activity)
MMRALLLLATIPTVIYAKDELVTPSCAAPASVEPRAPRKFGGDRIVFAPGTDRPIGMATLHEQYGLTVSYPANNWNLSDGVLVGVLTPAQIAELRCDPIVARIVLGPRTPESLPQEPPPPAVRLGIVYDYNPTGQSKPLSRGAHVARVERGSVAERAGLLPGDNIVRFDDHDIEGQDLLKLLSTKNPGDAVVLVILRNGTEKSLVAQF